MENRKKKKRLLADLRVSAYRLRIYTEIHNSSEHWEGHFGNFNIICVSKTNMIGLKTLYLTENLPEALSSESQTPSRNFSPAVRMQLNVAVSNFEREHNIAVLFLVSLSSKS